MPFNSADDDDGPGTTVCKYMVFNGQWPSGIFNWPLISSGTPRVVVVLFAIGPQNKDNKIVDITESFSLL